MQATILALLAVGVTTGTASFANCPSHVLDHQLPRLACGDVTSARDCLAAGIDLAQVNAIAGCLVQAGCPQADATAGAVSIASACRRSDSRREGQAQEALAKAGEDATPIPASPGTSPYLMQAGITMAPQDPIMAKIVRRQDNDDDDEDDDGGFFIEDGTTVSCKETSMVKTSSCTRSSGSKTCTPTEVAESSCADGLICKKTKDGDEGCLRAKNGLDGAGIGVAIAFGAAIISFVAALTISCCRERSNTKKSQAALRGGLGEYKTPAVDIDVERSFGGPGAGATAGAGAATTGVTKGKARDVSKPLITAESRGLTHQRSMDSFRDGDRTPSLGGSERGSPGMRAMGQESGGYNRI